MRTLRKEKWWAQRDNQRLAHRLKLLVGESLPLQRECVALKKKAKEQKDNIDKWLRDLPQDEASFSQWYEEEMRQVRGSA